MIRKVYRQNFGPAIYTIPDTDHWAGWKDADAVVYHGTLLAFKDDAGHWVDAETADRVSAQEARRYGAMRPIGISTR